MATIGDRYATQARLRSAMRAKVGLPNETALLPDTLDDGTAGPVDDAIADALSELNNAAPRIGVGTFLTVADQDSYSPLPVGGLKLRRVYWPVGGGGSGLDCPDIAGDPNLGLNLTMSLGDGTWAVSEPGAVLALSRQLGFLRAWAGHGATIINGETAYLSPTPAADGTTVYFSYYLPLFATAFLVEDDWIEPFFNLAAAYLYERLATGAGAVTDVADGPQGSRISTRASQHAMEMSSRKRLQFELALPPPLPDGALL